MMQILSMCSGLCMQQMMLPAAAMHHVTAPHLPQLMGAGILGFTPSTDIIPCSPPQFPTPLLSGTNNTLQMFGFSNQMPPISKNSYLHAKAEFCGTKQESNQVSLNHNPSYPLILFSHN